MSHCKNLFKSYLQELHSVENDGSVPVSNNSVIDVFSNISESASSTNQSISNINSSTTVPKKAKLMDFFKTIQNTPAIQLPINPLDQEIDNYLSSSCLPIENLINYWSNSHSTLKTLAIQILCAPASSATVERIFSAAGRILTPIRSSLSSDMLEKLLIISLNK